MSGCALCVYDLYIEAKSTYTKALSTSLNSLKEHNVPASLWPKEALVLSKKQSNSARAAAAADVSSPPEPASFQDEDEEDSYDRKVDASMKAFMELEKRLKKSSWTACQSSSSVIRLYSVSETVWRCPPDMIVHLLLSTSGKLGRGHQRSVQCNCQDSHSVGSSFDTSGNLNYANN